jgi:hypothetical protein
VLKSVGFFKQVVLNFEVEKLFKYFIMRIHFVAAIGIDVNEARLVHNHRHESVARL